MTVEVSRFHSKQNVSRQEGRSQNHDLINKEGQMYVFRVQTAPGLRFEVQVVAGIEVALAIEERKVAV